MRLVAFFVTAVIAVSAAACGGEDAAPLTLQQRVAGEADAPGSQVDPQLRAGRITVTSIENVRSVPPGLFSPEEEDVSAMEEAGFVSALVDDTRVFPPESVDPVGEPHVATLVMQFASEEEAADMADDVLHDDALEPCPGCVENISEFEVDDIPDAQGVQRIITRTVKRDDPYADYRIIFADGPFAYQVDMHGPPDKVSQEQAEQIAKNLFERIEGSPPSQQ
jgi:hypothetical protein